MTQYDREAEVHLQTVGKREYFERRLFDACTQDDTDFIAFFHERYGTLAAQPVASVHGKARLSFRNETPEAFLIRVCLELRCFDAAVAVLDRTTVKVDIGYHDIKNHLRWALHAGKFAAANRIFQSPQRFTSLSATDLQVIATRLHFEPSNSQAAAVLLNNLLQLWEQANVTPTATTFRDLDGYLPREMSAELFREILNLDNENLLKQRFLEQLDQFRFGRSASYNTFTADVPSRRALFMELAGLRISATDAQATRLPEDCNCAVRRILDAGPPLSAARRAKYLTNAMLRKACAANFVAVFEDLERLRDVVVSAEKAASRTKNRKL